MSLKTIEQQEDPQETDARLRALVGLEITEAAMGILRHPRTPEDQDRKDRRPREVWEIRRLSE